MVVILCDIINLLCVCILEPYKYDTDSVIFVITTIIVVV